MGFSSYIDYFGKGRNENRILKMDSLPEYFDNKKEFDEYIDDWLKFKNEYESPLSLA